jgi:hypothetical protein
MYAFKHKAMLTGHISAHMLKSVTIAMPCEKAGNTLGACMYTACNPDKSSIYITR